MSAFKLFNLFLLSSLALLAALGPNTAHALSVDSAHLRLARHVHHDAIALHKRGNATTNTKHCKPRPSPAVTSSHAASSSLAPAPVSSPAPVDTGSSGMGKVGIGYPISDTGPLKYFKTNKVGPVYTWSPWRPEGATQLGYTFIPMLWGSKQIPDFQRLVVKGYATHVLGMNEPNQENESYMTPQAGASMWKTYIDPLKNEGYTLISPACTNAPTGIKWIQDFRTACQGCTVDALALHWYGISYQDMIDYLGQFHDTFPDKPVYVTEFACQDFSGKNQACPDVFEFMGKVQAFMDSQSWIIAYFAFGVMYDMGNVNPLNQLLGSNGQPTSLGYYYITH